MFSQSELKEIFHYDYLTGLFIWKINVRGLGGKVAGGSLKIKNSKLRYIRLRHNGKGMLAHRAAFVYMTGKEPRGVVDHIDRDGTNNAWLNIRDVSRSTNQKNRRLNKNNKYGIMGMYYVVPNRKWYVEITVSGKKKNLGIYSDFFEACCARKSAESNYGFHDNHGN